MEAVVLPTSVIGLWVVFYGYHAPPWLGTHFQGLSLTNKSRSRRERESSGSDAQFWPSLSEISDDLGLSDRSQLLQMVTLLEYVQTRLSVETHYITLLHMEFKFTDKSSGL